MGQIRQILSDRTTLRERLQREFARDQVTLNLLAAACTALPHLPEENVYTYAALQAHAPELENALVNIICYYIIFSTTVPELKHGIIKTVQKSHTMARKLSKAAAQPVPLTEYRHPSYR